jgi:transposase
MGWSNRLYQASSHPMELRTIGMNLGKTVFHLVGLHLCGKVVVTQEVFAQTTAHFTANLQVKLIGMEACGGSHFLTDQNR